jgi:hypothetical protein
MHTEISKADESIMHAAPPFCAADAMD